MEVQENNTDITPVNIEEQMKDAYLEYAMSVIVGRALPDARDGLKPVHRRVLFAMNELGNFHDKAFKKSARIAGDTIGKYHPHGESSVYDAVVRLVQDFSMRYPLIIGQGNFGSVDGDPAAAMRYTEVKLSKITQFLLQDLDKETVDFRPNYDNSLKEPTVLPSQLPNLLVNGSSGIAVGMATNIPPHNVSEIIQGVQALIKNPDVSVSELMEIIPGPDFPTAGYIYGRKGLKEAYTTGKGIIKLRGAINVETFKKDRERIVVTEIPFQVNKAKLIESVAHLVRDKKIDSLSDIRDESDRTGMRIVFDLKKGEDSRVVINQLYKFTQLQVSFGISMLALDHQQPKLMNLKTLLSLFLSHRKEIVTRRTIYRLKKAREKAHILEGLKVAVENLDKVVEMIRASKDPAEARFQLMAEFDFSEVQSKAILDMKLQRLTGLEIEKIISDYQAILVLIKELEGILADDQKVLDIISEELSELDGLVGDNRRTRFIEEREEMTEEDLIIDENVLVTMTYSGYIKRMEASIYRSQKRGGKGVKGSKTSSEDFIKELFVATTLNYVLCFSNQGKVHWLKVHKIPEGSRISKGKAIVNLLNLSAGEKIEAIAPVKEFTEDLSVLMVTRKGIIKKTSVMNFSKPKKSGIISVKLDEGDDLVDARIITSDCHVVLVTALGKSIRFEEEQVRQMGRATRGVTGVRLGEGDVVVGMAVVDAHDVDSQLLTVTEKGYGKRTQIEVYRVQARGGSGVGTMKITDKNGPIVAVRMVSDQDEVLIASNKSKVMRTKVSEISEVGRMAQGVRIIKVEADERVAAVAKIVEEEE